MKNNKIISFFLSSLIIVFSATSAYAENLSTGIYALNLNNYSDYLLNKDLSSVTVAVVDSGVANIPTVKEKIIPGYDFVDEDTDASNDTSSDSHGTIIASIISEATKDLPIKIMPIRILDNKTVTIENIVSGIKYAVDNGASVINLSIGGSLTDCSKIDEAMEYAHLNNVSVVVAAGNEKRDITNYCPAHNKSAITVSAVDFEDHFANKFSNFGEQVDCCAPGINIVGYNSSGKSVCVNGTSFSAAFVSAGVSMLRLEYSQYSADEIQEKLKSICIDLGEEGFDYYYGFGLPDFSKLIINSSTITIKDNTAKHRYGETITLESVVSNVINGAEIHWFVNDIDTGKVGNIYSVENCKNSFSIQAKYIINGNIIAESQNESIIIRANFFDKLFAFFHSICSKILNSIFKL